MTAILNSISAAVISGEAENVKALTQQALDGGTEAAAILDQGLLPAMDVVGKRMKSGDMFIPEVLRSAQSMQKGLDLLLPLMSEADIRTAGVVVIGTVEGDLHDIGKNLVGIMLQGAGFQVHDLGTNVTAERFVQAVKEHKANVLGMSALLTTTMPKMEQTIKTLIESGLRDQVKVMIGGAPVTREFMEKIGADAYGPNAASAVDQARELLS